MINSLKKTVSFYKNSRKDWNTKRRLVVLESDDWGSIRMPNKNIYNTLIKKGFRLNNRPFERFDSIATNEDLTALFDLLQSFKDVNGNHPILTANIITANPDFEKIRKNNFQQYYFEEFTQTLKNYDTDFSIWENGVSSKVFFPQFHGREHLNVPKWMLSLNKLTGDDYEAFDYGLMGIPAKNKPNAGNVYQAAFDFCTKVDSNKSFIINSINDGIEIFKKHLKYYPKSFIAPVYTWDSYIEEILKKHDIRNLQSGRFQNVSNKKDVIKHNIGELKDGVVFNVRNAFFEPSTILDFNSRFKSLDQLKFHTNLAFRFNKPLTISLHRLNFVGRLEKKNRNINLELFRDYLKWLIKKYPEVEFLNTLELMKIISDENSNT